MSTLWNCDRFRIVYIGKRYLRNQCTRVHEGDLSYTIHRSSTQTLSVPIESAQLRRSLFEYSPPISFSNGAVCSDVFHYYSDYEYVTFDMFSTHVTWDPRLHILSDTIRACVTYVNGTKISRSECDRHYKNVVSLLEYITQDQSFINNFPTITTFYVYCEKFRRHTVPKDGCVSGAIAKDSCLVSKSGCLRCLLQVNLSLLDHDTDTDTCYAIPFGTERNENEKRVNNFVKYHHVWVLLKKSLYWSRSSLRRLFIWRNSILIRSTIGYVRSRAFSQPTPVLQKCGTTWE